MIRFTDHLVHPFGAQTRPDRIGNSYLVSYALSPVFITALGEADEPFAAFMLDSLTSVGFPWTSVYTLIFPGRSRHENQVIHARPTLSLKLASDMPVGIDIGAEAVAAEAIVWSVLVEDKIIRREGYRNIEQSKRDAVELELELELGENRKQSNGNKSNHQHSAQRDRSSPSPQSNSNVSSSLKLIRSSSTRRSHHGRELSILLHELCGIWQMIDEQFMDGGSYIKR